jgi:thioesterase domain-containing protein
VRQGGTICPLGEGQWGLRRTFLVLPDTPLRRRFRTVRDTRADAMRALEELGRGTAPRSPSTLTVSLPRELAEALDARARDAGRSVANELRALLAIPPRAGAR